MSKEIRTVLIFAGIFLVLAMCAAYFVNDTQNQVNAMKDTIAGMEAEKTKLTKEAKLHDGLVEELDKLKENFSHYVKILPAPEVATEERLMELLQEKCERAQFSPGRYTMRKKKKGGAAKRGRKKAGGGFREIDVTLSATATYEQFLRFLNSLERHESFLRVNSFSCTAPQAPEVDAEGNETWPLRIALNVSTFRYESGGK